MNQFLQSLIERHQGVGANYGARQLVQPRPKAKFEADTRPAFFAQNDLDNSYDANSERPSDLAMDSYSFTDEKELNSGSSSESFQPLQDKQVSRLLNTEISTVPPDINQQIKQSNARVRPVSSPFVAEKSIREEPSPHLTANENVQPASSLYQSVENTARFNRQPSLSLNEINQQIQKSLQHLNSQQLQHEDNKSANKTLFESASNNEAKNTDDGAGHQIQKIWQRLNNQHVQQQDGRGTHEAPRDFAVDTDRIAIDETNHRIQSILQRLNSDHHSQVTDRQERKSKQETIVEDSANASTDKQQISNIPLPAFVASEPVTKVIKRHEEKQAMQRESRQPGLLQTPNWLLDLQANLNNRMQQVDAKTEPEPIINVSIGRIEIKAVQAASPKQPKVSKKPSSVMGLDDYLKQRESRGRA